MNTWRARLLFLIPLFTMSLAPQAHAQWAVIDVGAIAQLVQEVATLQQALTTAQQELSQEESEYAAITGNRGMSQLLSGTNWNYLPTDWSDLQSVLSGTSGPYGSLGSSVQSLVTSNAVLSPQQVASLSSTEQTQLTSDRNSTALLEALTRDALSTTSARFSELQQLVNAIPTATDEKGVLDLQARIEAQETLLQNDEMKLGILYQVAASQQQANEERAQEQAIAGIGSLSSLPPLNF
jgi:type IV secretion system protein VirB5